MKENIIKVKGMVCGGCENRIKNALKEIEGIESVEASHESGIIKVVCNEEVKEETITDTINDIGFEVIQN